MASTGFTVPTGFTDWADGDVSWVTPENILVEDSSNASAGVTSLNATSSHLAVSIFGFAIPSGSTIDGIEVEATTLSWNPTNMFAELGLTKNNSTVVGTPTTLDSSGGTFVYGGPTDKWGTTWTEAEVESANFGPVFQANYSASIGATLNVDSVTVNVYYTEPAGPPPTYRLAPMRRGR